MAGNFEILNFKFRDLQSTGSTALGSRCSELVAGILSLFVVASFVVDDSIPIRELGLDYSNQVRT